MSAGKNSRRGPGLSKGTLLLFSLILKWGSFIGQRKRVKFYTVSKTIFFANNKLLGFRTFKL